MTSKQKAQAAIGQILAAAETEKVMADARSGSPQADADLAAARELARRIDATPED